MHRLHTRVIVQNGPEQIENGTPTVFVYATFELLIICDFFFAPFLLLLLCRD